MSNKILIVEDESDIRAALSAWFEDESFEIAEAGDGISGLMEFQRFQPDIALLDINIPGMSGIELCKQIRTSSNIPLVMFTADAEAEEVKAAIAEGATDYVLKHSGFDELIDRIMSHLGAKRQHLSTTDLAEAIPAHSFTGPDQYLSNSSASNRDSVKPTPDDLWTWSGEYFGYRDGSELWTHDGRHVGRFRRGAGIFTPAGSYLGELANGRLISDWHKTARRASSFTPSSRREPRFVFADREPFDMLIGYKDFPGVADVQQ